MNEGMNSENMNINYNAYNIKNSQTSEMNNNAIINQYRDNYRMLRNENVKKSKTTDQRYSRGSDGCWHASRCPVLGQRGSYRRRR